MITSSNPPLKQVYKTALLKDKSVTESKHLAPKQQLLFDKVKTTPTPGNVVQTERCLLQVHVVSCKDLASFNNWMGQKNALSCKDLVSFNNWTGQKKALSCKDLASFNNWKGQRNVLSGKDLAYFNNWMGQKNVLSGKHLACM